MGNDHHKLSSTHNLGTYDGSNYLKLPGKKAGAISDNNLTGKISSSCEDRLIVDLRELNVSKRRKLNSEEKPSKNNLISTVFRWKGVGGEIYISGTFNDWKEKILLKKSDEVYYTIIKCRPGHHSFKFFKDGEWIHDEAQLTEPNEFGTLNNYVDVRQEDVDIDYALSHDEQHARKSSSSLNLALPDLTYSQEIPRRPNPYTDPSFFKNLPLPLPPYLNETILNASTAPHNDPSLLTSPYHVQVNHLYASSITAGVAALSVTVRYRNKYITTLFYKKIT